LFEDLKAKRRGDLITVILDERTNAAKNASTSASRSTGVDVAAPQVLGRTATVNGNPASLGLSSSSDFSGSGDSSQSNSLFGNITARVTQVEPNGNLHIQGEKQLTLNSGLEIISVTGVVRPTDLTPQNTILSTLIADADIVYSGRGMIADNNRAGWLTRVFTSKFWPF
jgi:flagellar L-ring protein precursor FlgH